MRDRKNYSGRNNRDANSVSEVETFELSETSEAPVEEKKNRTGHITGCELLNVRREPSSSSSVIGTLTSSDMVVIRDKNDYQDFFKVITPKGVSGYCMKKYIAFND